MAFDNIPMKPVEKTEIKPVKEPEVQQKDLDLNAFATATPEQIMEDMKNLLSSYLASPPSFPSFNVSFTTNNICYNPPIKTVTEILEEARDNIIKKGWGRGTAWQTDANYEKYNFCMIGAISEVNSDAASIDRAAQVLAKIIRSSGINSFHYIGSQIIPYYNDSIAANKEEVISLFDEAINYSRSHRL